MDAVPVGEGFITPWSNRLVDGKHVWGGAAYRADGTLVRESQRQPGIFPSLAGNPETVKPKNIQNRLHGRWLYGGIWFEHFGHFMLETLTRLPIRDLQLEGIVFHAHRQGEVHDFHRDLMRRLGITVPVITVKAGFLIEDLVSSVQQVVLGESASPHAASVWQAVADPPRRPRRRLFYSRSALETAKRDASNDAMLDEEMAARGYDVVHPEALSMNDQLHLLAETDVLVGASGSALHGSVFMRPQSRVVEIGDTRSRNEPWSTQRVIDEAVGRTTQYVDYHHVGMKRDRVRDIAATMAEFDALDL
ncbi:MAG: glycosyltransferase family 61 protein [Pseudoclavibacter sp.]